MECNKVNQNIFNHKAFKLPNLKSKFYFSSKLYAERHSDVSILYADVVNFTQMTTQLPVRLLVETLHELFVKFDEASAVSI